MRRMLFVAVLGAVIVALLAFASEAGAHLSVSAQNLETSKGWFYTTNVCAGQEAALADEPPQIYASAFAQLVFKGVCSGIWTNIPTGDLAVKWKLYKLVQGVKWMLCRERVWDYNNTPTSFMDVSRQWKDGAPCGTGWYNNKALAKVRDGGIWHTGRRWSGKVWFVG
jgi:hypothetical protein